MGAGEGASARRSRGPRLLRPSWDLLRTICARRASCSRDFILWAGGGRAAKGGAGSGRGRAQAAESGAGRGGASPGRPPQRPLLRLQGAALSWGQGPLWGRQLGALHAKPLLMAPLGLGRPHWGAASLRWGRRGAEPGPGDRTGGPGGGTPGTGGGALGARTGAALPRLTLQPRGPGRPRVAPPQALRPREHQLLGAPCRPLPRAASVPSSAVACGLGERRVRPRAGVPPPPATRRGRLLTLLLLHLPQVVGAHQRHALRGTLGLGHPHLQLEVFLPLAEGQLLRGGRGPRHGGLGEALPETQPLGCHTFTGARSGAPEGCPPPTWAGVSRGGCRPGTAANVL